MPILLMQILDQRYQMFVGDAVDTSQAEDNVYCKRVSSSAGSATYKYRPSEENSNASALVESVKVR